MYYEDIFVPLESDLELYMENENNLISAKNSNDIKLLNKHFHREMRKINTKLGKKKVTIEFYSSGPVNSTITHAVSGSKQTGFLVGSVYEDLFFKVVIATNNIPLTLFYYSPEEYERHQHVTLSVDIKEKWNVKYLNASLLLKSKETN